MSVSCECCVLSGRGLCVGLITRPEESECGVSLSVASITRRPWPTRVFCAVRKVLLSYMTVSFANAPTDCKNV
jgi:hypothetical protein